MASNRIAFLLNYNKLLFLLTFFLLTACGASNSTKPSDVSVSSNAKVILMPIDAEISLLTAAGLIEPNAEWTENAIKGMTEGVGEIVEEKGLSVSAYTHPTDLPDELSVQLEKLHQAVVISRLNAQFQPLPSYDGSQPWTLGDEVRQLKQETGADYALFILARDSYSSAGRAIFSFFVAIAFGVVPAGGAQYGIVSLVDLNTGDLVWVNSISNNQYDLRESVSANEAVKSLLQNMPIADLGNE